MVLVSQGHGISCLALLLNLSAATAIQNGKFLEDSDTGATTVSTTATAYTPWTTVTTGGGYVPQSMPCYEAGNSTLQADCSTGLPPAQLVQKMRTAEALLEPAEPTTTKAPEPTVICGCAAPANSSTGLPPADIVQILRPQESLKGPKASATSCSCSTTGVTYFSPRVEESQTSLDMGGYQPKTSHLESPHITLVLPIPQVPHLEQPGQTLQEPQETPTHPDRQSQVQHQPQSQPGSEDGQRSLTTARNSATRITRYVIHSETLRPGAPATILSGTTYSLPTTRVVLKTVISGTTYSTKPTHAVVYVNGEAKPAPQISGLSTEYDVVSVGASSESSIFEEQSAWAYTTSEGVTLFSTRVHVTRTKLDVPTGTREAGESGGDAATSTSVSDGEGGGQASATSSDGSAEQQTGAAAERLTTSGLCLGIGLIAVILL